MRHRRNTSQIHPLGGTVNLSTVNTLSWTTIVPIVISVLALGVSGFTLYINYLAQFAPLITVGGPVYQFAKAAPTALDLDTTNNEEFDPLRDRLLAAILVPIVFTHESGKPGVITDVMLRVSREEKHDNWLFEPRLNVNERAYLTSFDPQGHQSWIESAFSPIPLAKGSQAKRFILFQAKKNELFPSGRLRVGRYSIDVLCRINEAAGYRKVNVIKVDFSKEVLTNLQETAKYIPPPESITQARDRLNRATR
jgi:hypothetical protein